MYKTVRGDAVGLHRELEELRRSVTQLEPNADESRLRDCLMQLVHESNTYVDVFTLQSAYGDDSTFWSALRGLLEKDCVALTASLPTTDFAVSSS